MACGVPWPGNKCFRVVGESLGFKVYTYRMPANRRPHLRLRTGATIKELQVNSRSVTSPLLLPLSLHGSAPSLDQELDLDLGPGD